MTEQYAVIGNPVAHSKSPAIHAAFARQTGQDIAYTAIAAEDFASTADRLRTQGMRGLNVTIPFKLDAARYATQLAPSARVAGAVNCLRFEGAEVLGANFDGAGLLRDIEDNLGLALAGRRVLLLGAGGAARGAIAPLRDAGARLTLANRTAARAAALAAETGIEAAPLAGLGTGFDVVINATAASLQGEALPLPGAVFTRTRLAYDMLYGRGLTPFLRQAQEAGAGGLADGVGMLVEQAADAFAWWRGVRPDTRAVIAALTVPLL